MSKINIAQKMQELIDTIDLDGVDIPIAPECKDEWSEDYAIVDGFYFDVLGFNDDSPYVEVNHDNIRLDIEDKIKKHFGVNKLYYGLGSDKQRPKKGELVVRLHYRSQEIEAYYE